jgi:hypothetical protein
MPGKKAKKCDNGKSLTSLTSPTGFRLPRAPLGGPFDRLAQPKSQW